MRNESIEWATKRGWIATPTSGGHFALTHPDAPGEKVICAATPSDHRAIKNTQARIKWFEKKYSIDPDSQKDRKRSENVQPFKQSRTPDGRLEFTAHCSKCGIEDTRRSRPGTESVFPSNVRNQFLRIGWTAGSYRNKDVCPSCTLRQKLNIGNGADAEAQAPTTLPPTTQESAPSPAPAAEMSVGTYEFIISLPSPAVTVIDASVKSGLWGCNREEVISNMFLSKLRGE